MNAVATEATAQYAVDAKTAGTKIPMAGGPVQFTSMINEKTDNYRWTYSGTVIYGTITTSGQITQYGKFSITNKISLRGNTALLDPFWVERARSGGSAMKFTLWFWNEVSTNGGLWKDTSRYCAQSAVQREQAGLRGDLLPVSLQQWQTSPIRWQGVVRPHQGAMVERALPEPQHG